MTDRTGGFVESSWRLKLRWADRRLADFHRAMAPIVAVNRFPIVREVSADRREHTFRVRISELPPPDLSLLVGEVIGALRAALDHIVYAASMTPTRPDPSKTAFPIFTDATEYQRQGRQRIRLCSAAVQTVIENAQPFRRADVGRADDIPYAPLAVLNGLVNADKHRVIPVLLTSTIGGGWIKPAGILSEDWASGPLVDGAVIARFTFSTPKEDAEVGPYFFFDLKFEDGEPGYGLPVAGTLKGAHETVDGVLTDVEGAMAGQL